MCVSYSRTRVFAIIFLLLNGCQSQSCNMHISTPMDRASDELKELPCYSTGECCAACLNNTDCEAWTYVGSEAGACANQCHLKYAVGPVANYSGCCGRSDTYPYCTTGWAKIEDPICFSGDYIEDTDYYGGDLHNFPTDGIGYCCHACTVTKDCVGFSFEKSSQHCFLKSSRQMPKAHDGITSYFFSPVPYYQDVAIRILYFAYGAYCDADAIKSWTCKWCKYIPNFQVQQVITKNYLQVFVGYDPDANQSTANSMDWIDYNLDPTLIPYEGVPNGYVDEGFSTAWLWLQPEVISGAQTLMEKYVNKTVLITGHSLGAAVAQLCALEIAKNGQKTNNKVYLYTYGSPRWGNLYMAQYFASMVWYHYRLVNVHDAVPQWPGPTNPDVASEYHHTWNEIWYTSDDPLVYQQCDSSGEGKACTYWQESKSDHDLYLNIQLPSGEGC